MPDRPRDAAARHARPRRGKPSEYGIRLREKQKLKRFYGVLEAPVPPLLRAGHAGRRRTPASSCSRSWSAGSTTSSTGSGFAVSRAAARQMVAHGHVAGQRPEVRHPEHAASSPATSIKVKDRASSLKLARETLPARAIVRRSPTAWS